MTILEDVNNKPGEHENIRFYCELHGIILRRQKLNVGDYIIAPNISIDTKQGMLEVYNNLVQDHERFRKMCIRAQEDGTRLIILVENHDGLRDLDDVELWHNPRIDEYYKKYAFALSAKKAGKDIKIPAPPISSKRLVRMMRTMSERYGVEWQFCSYEETGKKVVSLLSGY